MVGAGQLDSSLPVAILQGYFDQVFVVSHLWLSRVTVAVLRLERKGVGQNQEAAYDITKMTLTTERLNCFGEQCLDTSCKESD